jgi:regulator of replication initiation timing
MFQKAKELLDGGKIDEAVFNELNTEFETVVSKLNNENKSLRLEKENLSKSYDEVMKSKNDIDSKMQSIDDQIKKAREEGKSELIAQLESEREAQETLRKSLNELQEANKALKLDTEVRKQLDRFDVKKEDKELIEFRLRADVALDDNGNPIFKDGTPIDKAFDSFFEKNKHRLNPVGDAGTGSGTDQSAGSGGRKTISRQEFEKLPPIKKAEAAKTMKIEG